jgi:replicative DNA helicase
VKGTVPHSNDIEKYIIGALILEKHNEIHRIQEHDFFNPEHQLLYRVIKWMKEKNKAIDLISVSDWAKKKSEDALDIAVSCINAVTTTAIFNSHLKQLKMYSTKRQILRRISELETLVYDSEHDIPEDLKNDALEILSKVETPESEENTRTLEDILTETLTEIENQYNGTEEQKLLTGFDKLDKMTAGFHAQELTILAARPGVGKTALALNLLINLSKKGNSCLFVSREMSDKQLCKRIISNLSGIDGNKLRQPKALQDKDWMEISTLANEMDKLKGSVMIDDQLLTIQQIRGAVRKLKNKKGIDILFVDYLGLVKTTKKCESKRLEIEDVSWGLKQISKEFNIPVVSLCQLNRDTAEGKGEEPQLHHLRESGAIEQDADNVWMIHEPQEDKNNPFTDPSMATLITKLLIRKQRNGPVGTITLKCAKNNFKYFDN